LTPRHSGASRNPHAEIGTSPVLTPYAGGEPEISIVTRAVRPPTSVHLPHLPHRSPHHADLELTPSQRQLILGLPERLSPDRIDRLWIFAPHLTKSRESGFVVISLFEGSDVAQPGGPPQKAPKRGLVTYRYETGLTKGSSGVQHRVTEEGSAPAERIDRVIAGVQARSGADSPEPLVEDVAGSWEVWQRLIERIQDAP